MTVKPLIPFLRVLLRVFLLLTATAWSGIAAQAAEPTFDIDAFEIEGNTVLPGAQVEAAVLPHMGPARAMKDVEAARTALEQLYQQAGYLTVVVDIPEQRVDQGVVRLAVLEGRVGSIYVLGSRFHSQGWIRSHLGGLEAGGVPDFNLVQRQLAALGRGDDRQIQPVLRPGRLPGTVDVDLQVRDQFPISSNIELHNNHSHDTDESRVSATLRYDNFMQSDQSLSLTYLTAPTAPEQSRVLIFNYGIPLDDGDSLSFSLTNSNSNNETLGGTQMVAQGRTYTFRRQDGWSTANGYRSLGYGFDYKDLHQHSDRATPVRYLPLQLTFSDLWNAGADRIQYTLSATAAFQPLLKRRVPCVDATGADGMEDQFNCMRSGASGSFGVIKFDGRWRHSLSSQQALSVRFGVQLASGPLVSGEQYALGGADSVRSYYESEVSGDNGVLGSLEWQGPRLWESLPLPQAQLTPLAFFDIARAYTLEPLAGQAHRGSLASAGLGLRLNSRDLDVSLDLGSPLHSTQYSPRGELRLHAKAVARF